MTANASEAQVQDKVRRSISRIQSLPALSNVVTKIIALSDDPNVSGEQVAEVVAKDQAMVTAILKIVNSPFYGLSRRVSSITHAIVLLGYRTVRNIALSTTLVNTFSGASRDQRFDRHRFWMHSVGTASAAAHVCRKTRKPWAEEAFLAGLIHDMGRIVFDHYFSKEFSVALDMAASKGIPLVEAEEAVFGLDHAEVGRLIAANWNFPPAVVDAISSHHRPQEALETSELAVVTYLGNQLARIVEDRNQTEASTADQPSEADLLDVAVVESLGLTPESLEELIAEVEGEMEKARKLLGALMP